jgi:hypothetical protein
MRGKSQDLPFCFSLNAVRSVHSALAARYPSLHSDFSLKTGFINSSMVCKNLTSGAKGRIFYGSGRHLWAPLRAGF